MDTFCTFTFDKSRFLDFGNIIIYRAHFQKSFIGHTLQKKVSILKTFVVCGKMVSTKIVPNDAIIDYINDYKIWRW